MRKVLHEERSEGRWEGRDERQQVAKEMVYTVVHSATGEWRDGALGETGFQRLQTGFYKNKIEDRNQDISARGNEGAR